MPSSKSFAIRPGVKSIPGDTAQTMQVREFVSDPKLSSSVSHMERTLSRIDQFGTGEPDLAKLMENLISDNLRDLTEDRYPSNVLFGAPPRPLDRNMKPVAVCSFARPRCSRPATH